MSFAQLKDSSIDYFVNWALGLITSPVFWGYFVGVALAVLAWLTEQFSKTVPLWAVALLLAIVGGCALYLWQQVRKLESKVATLTPPEQPVLNERQNEFLCHVAFAYNTDDEALASEKLHTVLGGTKIQFDLLKRELEAWGLVKESGYGRMYLTDKGKAHLEYTDTKQHYEQMFNPSRKVV